MKWEKVKLNDVTTLITKGTTPSTYGFDFEKQGINFIRAEGISKDGFVDETTFLKITSECHEKLKRSQLEYGDILFSIAGMALGKTGLVLEGFLPANTNQAVAIIRVKKDKVIPKFLQFQFINPIFYKKVNSISGQAAQPNINLAQLGSLDILLPSFSVQSKITSILSAYDDLIENNSKRIKLLEEAAQNIYKEWFVHFRFPGYEKAKFENGLPKRWRSLPFSEVADYINGFAFKPHHHSSEGVPIVKIKELKNGIEVDTPRYSGTDVPSVYYFSNNSILFSWSAHLDVYWWSFGDAILNQHIFLVQPYDIQIKEYVYFALKNSMDDFRGRANGATMKHIKRKELDSVKCILPDSEIAKGFSKSVRPYLNMITNLITQNQNLKEARDILLPRLMNGEIEVDATIHELEEA